jgi:diguanylate cyclase (GGDEF)-like protein
VGEADSRVALAIKHGVELNYGDLRRERDRLPVFGPRESWEPAPRSVALLPLTAEGRTLGAVVAWHPLPDRFGPRELELLRRICSVAPIPLRSATQYEALDRRASTDALTGLANRATFESRLATAAAYFDRYARPFSIAILDVDFFKKFNDTWGHEAGDRVLKHVAEVVRTTVRDSDLAARLGGEEFVVLMPETGVRAAAEAAERIRRAIEARSVIWNGRPLSVTASFGVASCPENVATPAEVLAAADAALYRSKGAGRNRVSTALRPGAASEPDPTPKR